MADNDFLDTVYKWQMLGNSLASSMDRRDAKKMREERQEWGRNAEERAADSAERAASNQEYLENTVRPREEASAAQTKTIRDTQAITAGLELEKTTSEHAAWKKLQTVEGMDDFSTALADATAKIQTAKLADIRVKDFQANMRLDDYERFRADAVKLEMALVGSSMHFGM